MSGKAYQSNFVTIVAWVFIALGGFSTLIAVLQNVIVNVLYLATPSFRDMVESSQKIPVPYSFAFSHMRLFMLCSLVVFAITLLSAIGLLRRRNWARILFVIVLAMGIVWSIFILILQVTSKPGFPIGPQAGQFNFLMRMVTVFASIALGGVLSWLLRRMMSTQIRAEFR